MLKKVIFLNEIIHFRIGGYLAKIKYSYFSRPFGIMLNKRTFLTFIQIIIDNYKKICYIIP